MDFGEIAKQVIALVGPHLPGLLNAGATKFAETAGEDAAKRIPQVWARVARLFRDEPKLSTLAAAPYDFDAARPMLVKRLQELLSQDPSLAEEVRVLLEGADARVLATGDRSEASANEQYAGPGSKALVEARGADAKASHNKQYSGIDPKGR